MHCSVYSRSFEVQKDAAGWWTGTQTCSQLTTVIHRCFFTLFSSFSPSPLLSPALLSGERLCVIHSGLRGQIAIYSIPVGEVCVSRL